MKLLNCTLPTMGILGFLGALALTSNYALARTSEGASTTRDDAQRVEVDVEKALIPVQGYDDNDLVEIVLHGRLPNTCYQLDATEVERVGENGLRVRQFARVTNQGLCYDKGDMPPYMKMAVPFTTTVRVGRMNEGVYSVAYQKSATHIAYRAFGVEKAVLPSVDNYPYAPVSSVVSRDYYSGVDSARVTFSGVLTSDCVELDPEVRVERQGDVFVILPTVRPLPVDPNGGLCELVYLPFEQTIELGRLPSGHYLVHVRSMAGNAVNKVFEVIR